MLRSFGGLAVCIAVGCVSVLAEHAVTDRADLQLARDASATLNRYTQLTIFDNVEIEVSGGIITLTGDVTMPHKREEIAKRVALVEGVRDVRNRIRVLPASTSDDQLRYQIARAIYDSPHFLQYALGPNPPIRIIVEHGHVTLRGIVHNDTDRMIARSLADQFPALSLTNELKTNAELRDRRAIVR
ncbi:MAG TPA: BON domain-containing protein [Vicinamibacterales bacterium]|nr:BON domain-containing protein [Vicinamibacterales bacterium]